MKMHEGWFRLLGQFRKIYSQTYFREFLTGFHKRKLAKTEAAKKHAIEREKKERLESRREASVLLIFLSFSFNKQVFSNVAC
jgi:hypothetical protein